MKVAKFNYHHGCSIYIDNKYVCETNVWDNDGDFDFNGLHKFLGDNGVTHVIDEESFEDEEEDCVDEDGEWNPPAHTLEEFIALSLIK